MEIRTPYVHLVPPLAMSEYEALKASIGAEGRRIDQFSREPRAGFDQWGDQNQLFANPLRPDCLQHSEVLTR